MNSQWFLNFFDAPFNFYDFLKFSFYYIKHKAALAEFAHYRMQFSYPVRSGSYSIVHATLPSAYFVSCAPMVEYKICIPCANGPNFRGHNLKIEYVCSSQDNDEAGHWRSG